jgi:hypothetical protein
VTTNVPYRKRANHCDALRCFCEQYTPEGKKDLATVFLQRCLELCEIGGTTSIVLPQNWLFLTTYKKLREKLLRKDTWTLIARLGPGAFETISGEVVKAILLIINRGQPHQDGRFEQGSKGLAHLISGLDVSTFRTAKEKAEWLPVVEVQQLEQKMQLGNPDARVNMEDNDKGGNLAKHAISMRGIVSGDNDKCVRKFWEVKSISGRWRPLHSTPQVTGYFTGKEHAIGVYRVEVC